MDENLFKGIIFMTEQEVKELELFKEWFKTVDKHHYQYKLQYEEAWFARAKLDKKPYIDSDGWNDQATV